MSWQSTLVEPVSAAKLTVVQVTCKWCPWRSVTIDASTELGRAQVRSLRQGHVCAMRDPDAAFADIASEYGCDGGLYAAVLEAQQHNPNELDVIIGMKAWAQLDEERQRQEFTDLLQAYVELVNIQREEDRLGEQP